MTTAPRDPRSSEAGVALVLCLLFVLALSVVAASLTVLAQTETYASVNYRMMSQARYGAESGVHKALNYLLNSYTRPGGPGDPLTNYNMTVSPVTYNGQPVVLSATSAVAANYPAAATQTAFNSAAQGTLAAGSISVQYAASATLLSMRQISAYGSGTTTVVQTWRVTADGTITGARTAQVEVSAVLEQQTVATHTYAAFATNAGCGAVSFSGSASTDSYDSTAPKVGGAVVISNSSGDVGTNGNLTESGGVTIHGTLSTPRTGVGNCANGAVDAETSSGSAVVTGGIIQLPQALSYITPALPSPLPGTATQSFAHNTGCGAISTCSYPDGAGTPNHLRFAGGTQAAPSSFGNVSLSSDVVLHIGAASGCPCYYNFNSLVMSGASQLVIDGGPVILNVAGQSGSAPPNQWMASPLTLTGGGMINGSLDPTALQILYGGTSGITLTGGTSSSAMVFAPNAPITLSGGADFYGSLLGKTVTDSGGTRIHYDRHLASDFFTVGNAMLSTFTWKKY